MTSASGALSTYDLIRATAERDPERIALQFMPTASLEAPVMIWSYQQLLAQITGFANWLHAHGLEAADAITIVLPNLPQNHVAVWGAEAAGIANPVNPWLESGHIISIMNRARTKVLVTLARTADAELWAKIAAIVEEVPTLRHVLTVDPARFAGGAPATAPAHLGGAKIEDFDTAFADQPTHDLLSDRRVADDDIAAYFHTGGTTGHPKLACLTHRNKVAIVKLLADAFELRGGQFICGVPLFHILGNIALGLLPFSVGGTVLLLTAGGFRSPGAYANFWKLVEKFSVNYMFGVPTVYSRLVEEPVGEADISSLRWVLCGGAPLSPELMRRFEATTGICMLQGYGSTETASTATLNLADVERPVGSIGRAVPGVEVKIVDLDRDGRWVADCDDDVAGHVVVRGPNVFPGYLDEPIDGEDPMLPDGWLKTGDLGRRDAEGFFWLTGRAKDLIIRGGHNIDPAMIEEPLLKHPAVAAVAVVGRPDRHAGEVPVAYVELRPGRSVGVDELIQYAAAHIQEKAALPKAIHVVERLPLTAVGKPFKPELVWRETESAFSTTLAELPELSYSNVVVGPDARRGALARVTIHPARGCAAEVARVAATAALGVYSTPVEITISSPPMAAGSDEPC